MRATPGPWSLVVLLLGLPVQVLASMAGSIQVAGQATRTTGERPQGPPVVASSSLLQENLSLQLASMPFGPHVALVSMGGDFTNANGFFGNGTGLASRAASLNVSAGFFPRRSYPLRLFARASFPSLGQTGLLAGSEAGTSVFWGGTFASDPGKRLPGLRFDFEESRTTRTRAAPLLGDVRRTFAAHAYRSVKDHQLNLSWRLDDDLRTGIGGVRAQGLAASWTSPRHHTQLTGLHSERPQVFAGLAATERALTLGHDQTFSDRSAGSFGAKVADATAPAAGGEARGSSGGLRAAWTTSLFDTSPLTLTTSADAGTSRTRGPGGDNSGNTYAGSVRGAWGRPAGPVQVSGSAGGGLNYCDCDFGNRGLQGSVQAGLGASTLTLERGFVQADYSLARVFAAANRGGERTEQHAKVMGRRQLGKATDAQATVGWDDTVRELVDITSGSVFLQSERALTIALGASSAVGTVALSGDVRHTRGTVVVPVAGQFVVGRPDTRSVTGASLAASAPLAPGLSASGQIIGTWTEAQSSPPANAVYLNLEARYVFGRMNLAAQYSLVRSELDALSSYQHVVRTSLTRPFDF